MSESQVVDVGLSGVDVQEQEKMLAEANAQRNAQRVNRREFYQAEEGLSRTGKQETDFNVSDITSSMVDKQAAELDRLEKEKKEKEKNRREFYVAEEGLFSGTGKQETDFNISDITSSMVDEQKAELERLKKEKNEKEMGAARKPYNKAVRVQMPHNATPVSHGLTDGAGQHNGSTLPKAQSYPAVTVQAEAQQYAHPPGHPERVHQYQDSCDRRDYRQQHAISHQSDLSAGYHNQHRPSDDQQYQNQINAHPPGLGPDHELQQHPQHDTYQDHPALVMCPPGVKRGPTVSPQCHPQPQSHHRYPSLQPVAMQNTEDEHHHRHSPRIHLRRIAAENQQLVDQIPDWLKIDNVVGVKIPGVHDPVTGIVKFVGVVQVNGVDKLITGVQLVSFMLDNTSM